MFLLMTWHAKRLRTSTSTTTTNQLQLPPWYAPFSNLCLPPTLFLCPSCPLPLSLPPSLLSRGQLTNFDKQKNKPAVLFEYEVQSLFELECGLCGALQQVISPLPPALFSLSSRLSSFFNFFVFILFYFSLISPSWERETTGQCCTTLLTTPRLLMANYC